MQTTHDQVNKLAGRPVEIEQLPDGKFIPLWMSFDSPPPKPEDTEEKALEGLLTLLLSKPKLDDSVADIINSEE